MCAPNKANERGIRKLTTRKRSRGCLHRRVMPDRPMCGTNRRISWPALLAMVASLMARILTRTAFSKGPCDLIPLLPVVTAFSPTFQGTCRDRLSKSIAYTSERTRGPGTMVNDKEYTGTIVTNQLTSTSRSASQSGVEVWDGVFSPEVCKELHELAIDHSERTTGEDYDEDEKDDDSLDGSSIFVYSGRNRSPEDKLTPIEQALESFLTAYYDREDKGDEHRNREVVVEYWCRQEHLNLEAHADVDEVWFERSCKQPRKTEAGVANHSSLSFRYPAIGHVLYLTKPTLGVGPTCVFPPKRDQGTDQQHRNGNDSIQDEIEAVVTIPAVPGRVLRFPGEALHAVPKPADIWFSEHGRVDSEEEEEEDDEKEDEEEEQNDDVEGEWDDDYDDDEWEDEDDDDDERSVILFNTWEASGDDINGDLLIGPIGVRLDPMLNDDSDIGIVDMMMSSVDMDGVEVDEDFVNGMVQYARQQKNQQLSKWREKYCTKTEEESTNEDHENDDDYMHHTVVYSKVHCQPRDSWKQALIHADPNDPEGHVDTKGNDKGSIRVPLMGDKLRRRYPKKAVRWTVPLSFATGVNEPTRPCEFPLSK